jgi:hypothetical protein
VFAKAIAGGLTPGERRAEGIGCAMPTRGYRRSHQASEQWRLTGRGDQAWRRST